MVHIGSQPIVLAPEEQARLRRVVSDERPGFAGDGPGALTTLLVEQPFFRRHRLLAVQASPPVPARQLHVAVSPFGEVRLLTGRLDRLLRLVDEERPVGLDDPDAARAYANLCDYWTIENELGDLLIERFADIPFWKPLTPAQAERVTSMALGLAGEVRPPELLRTDGGHLLTKWVVANRRLLKRELTVGRDGRLARVDEVKAIDLPVHAGRAWGPDGSRLVPIA